MNSFIIKLMSPLLFALFALNSIAFGMEAAPEPTTQCPICLYNQTSEGLFETILDDYKALIAGGKAQLALPGEFRLGRGAPEVVITPCCKQSIHTHCILKWMLDVHGKFKKDSACPLCRSDKSMSEVFTSLKPFLEPTVFSLARSFVRDYSHDDIMSCTEHGHTTLILATQFNKSENVLAIIKKARSALSPGDFNDFINTGNRSGETALHIAVANGSIETVRILLSAGAKTDLIAHGYLTVYDLAKFRAEVDPSHERDEILDLLPRQKSCVIQ